MNPTHKADVLPFPPLGRHLKRADFAKALTQGLGVRDRLQVFLHLGFSCHRCWEMLRSEARAGEGPRRPPAVCAGDGVAMALWRWLAVHSDKKAHEADEKSKRVQAIVTPLRGVHRFFASEGSEEPLGFLRLILEETRALALDGQDGIALLEDILRLFAEPDLQQQWEYWLNQIEDLREAERTMGRWGLQSHWLDLEMLTQTLLGDELRVAGRRDAAKATIRQAMEGLDREPADPEIVATVHELYSELARSPSEVLRHLLIAKKLLARRKIPGRQAENAVRRGRAWLADAAPNAAAAALREALKDFEDLPVGFDSRLSLEARHLLAAARLRRGDRQEARRDLEGAAELYSFHASPTLQAQRWWLLGRIDFDDRHDQEADANLWKAFHGLKGSASPEDIVKVLAKLGRLHTRTLRDISQQRATLERRSQGVPSRSQEKLALDLLEGKARHALARATREFKALLERQDVLAFAEERLAELGELGRRNALDDDN